MSVSIDDGSAIVPVIGAYVGEEAIRDDITRQLARVAEVRFCASAASAVEHCAAGRFDLLLATLRDEQGDSIVRTLTMLAATAPRVPVLLYDRITSSTVGLLRDTLVLEGGLRIEYAVRPFEPLAPLVRKSLASAMPPVIAPLLVQRLAHLAPPPLRPFITVAALKAPSRRGLAQLARWSGVTSRTIERRLLRARWAPAHVLLQACRALDVLWLMTEYGWSVHQVQRARGFSDASAITRLTQRYGGATPRDVREGIDFHVVLDEVVRRITAPSG